MAKRTGRHRNQLPHCYYEGYLEKRSFKEKTSRKLWACLCGKTLFFFNDKRDTDYIEKVELDDFLSLTDDNSVDRNLDAARMTLQLKQENIKFTAPNTEARELWKGFIRSVVELDVPPSLNLLPGQIHMLKEAVEKEKQRVPNPSSAAENSPYVSMLSDMPVCYHKVNRWEAELLLEREAVRGNLLLRPSRNESSFAVTTRQDLSGSVFKHYRVTRRPEGGFAIDVDNPVLCATLHDVINFLVEKTAGVLIPLAFEEAYEKSISFIQSDNENGEKSFQQASSSPVPPTVPPKPVRLTTPEPASDDEDYIYLNDTLPEEDVHTPPPAIATEVEKKPQKKAIMPPAPAPRRMISSPAFTPPSIVAAPTIEPPTSSRARCNTNPMGETISELKLMLEKKAKCL